MLPCYLKSGNLKSFMTRICLLLATFFIVTTITSHIYSTVFPAKSYDAYLILFPSNGNKILLVKDKKSSYWELPGGKAIRDDIDTWDEFFTTMKRNWKIDIGVELPWLNPYRKYNVGKKFYYIAKTFRMLQLSKFLPETGTMEYWKLVSVDDILKESLRKDHKEALQKAVNRGYINQDGMQL